MSDVVLAVISAAGGVVSIFIAIMAWRRSVNARYAAWFARRKSLEAALAQTSVFDKLDPAERERAVDALVRYLEANGVGLPSEPSGWRVTIERAPRSTNVEQPRDKHFPQTVEVQREDGSVVTLGVDPNNPESIGSFLDRVDPARGDRVLAVR